ncbi:DUF2269 family protein [bacterium]|nr:DUF2269 family protein [bacterium]
MYDWLKFVHVLAAIAWVGGVILLNTYAPMVMSKGTMQDKISFTKLVLFAGRVFMIAASIVLAFGVWLVIDAGIEFSQAWISIGFTGVLVGAVLGPVFYTPSATKLKAAYEAGDDDASDALGKRISLVSTVEMLLMLIVVWSMVFKPGL